MADVYGTNYKNAFQTSPPVNSEPAQAGGRVRAIWDSYTAAADASGTVIYLGGKKVPKGARIVDAWIDAAALGASVGLNLAVGGTNIITKAAGTSAVIERPAAGEIRDVKTTAESDITITTTTNAATGVIAACVFYVID